MPRRKLQVPGPKGQARIPPAGSDISSGGTAVVFHPPTASRSWRVSKARSSMLQQTEIHARTSMGKKKKPNKKPNEGLKSKDWNPPLHWPDSGKQSASMSTPLTAWPWRSHFSALLSCVWQGDVSSPFYCSTLRSSNKKALKSLYKKAATKQQVGVVGKHSVHSNEDPSSVPCCSVAGSTICSDAKMPAL